MKLSEFKTHLLDIKELQFELPDGEPIPEFFHITEIGIVNRHSMDCGGKVRQQRVIMLQIWDGIDQTHRLSPQKLIRIIEMSEKALNLEDGELEVEYQRQTVGQFSLVRSNEKFVLRNKFTDCLAMESCGIPENDTAKKTFAASSACSPGGGCC